MSDLISRQAAIEAVMECYDNDELFEVYEEKLRELPPAQPERIKGHWVNGHCDKCNEHAPFWCMASTYHESNFCPNCGADMRGGRW